jgi:DNA modification methylase
MTELAADMSAPYYQRHGVTVHAGDCLDRLAELPDESVHAVVCDPPYGLADVKPTQVVTALTAWAAGDREHVPDGRGFMGRAWDAFVPPPAVWDECLRVLKPGGHLLAFAGSRTADLMGLSVRMAGFEIRDTIMWVYGSGFPKSLDVSKAIDKIGGLHPNWNPDAYAAAVERSGLTHADVDRYLDLKASSCYWARKDHRAAVPLYAHWVKARDFLGLDDDFSTIGGEAEREVIGRSAHGAGNGSVVGLGSARSMTTEHDITAPTTPAAEQWSGWGTALKPAQEPIIVARKPLTGTVAATVLKHGTGGINVDACRVGMSGADREIVDKRSGGEDQVRNGIWQDGAGGRPLGERFTSAPGGRWPANVVLVHADTCEDGGACSDGCPVAELDRQSGTLKSGANPTRRGSDKFRDAYGEFSGQAECTPARGADSGGASRFFPKFRWEAKAGTDERPQVSGASHPTVKPVTLMRWLVRLVTPPGGVVLDPFAGSGTTGQAARAEGMRAVLIEGDPAYLPLIRARLDARPRQAAPPAAETVDDGPMDLLDFLTGDTA